MAKRALILLIVGLASAACRSDSTEVGELRYQSPSGWQASKLSDGVRLSRFEEGVGAYYPEIRIRRMEGRGVEDLLKDYRSDIGEAAWKEVAAEDALVASLPTGTARAFTRRFENTRERFTAKIGDDPRRPLKMDYVETALFMRGRRSSFDIRFGSAYSLHSKARPEFEAFVSTLHVDPQAAGATH